MRKLLLGLLLSLPLAAGAATSTLLVSTADTGLTPNTTGGFTPTSGAAIVVFMTATTTTQATATCTSSVGAALTFTQFNATTWNTTTHSIYGFVSNQFVTDTTASQTITCDTASDQATGTNLFVYQITGVTVAGTSGVVHSAVGFNGSGVTPSVVFSGSALTGNPTLVAIANQTQPAPGITPPTSWTEPVSPAGEIAYATPDGGGAVAHRDSGFTGTTITWGAASPSVWGAIGVELTTLAAPTFSAAPSCSAAADGVSCTYTASTTSTAYGVGVALADGAPTCTQIIAGQNDGGTAALATGSDANTGSADTIVVTGTNPIAKMDYYFCLSNAGGDSAVDSSQSDKLRSSRSGFAIVTMSSHSATGICNEDTYFTPDCADPDVFEYEDDTNESADCNVAIAATGDLTLTPVAGGDCDGRQTFEISYEDASSATTGLFTAPTVGTFATDDTVYINNEAPECPIPADAQIIVLKEDVAMTSIDLKVLGQCSDAEGDLLAFTITTGTLPVGTSLSGTGNKDWGGTPNTENEAGVDLVATITDIAGDTDTMAFTSYVVNTWLATDCDGLNFGQCQAAIIDDAPWREADALASVAGTECSEEDPGTVISQDPTAGAAIEATDEISVILAVACGDPATEKKIVFVLSDLTGLVRWVDYIPVAVVPGCEAGRYEENGCWATLPLASDSGKVAWVDYIPVGEVAPDDTGKWRYENNGWMPVDDLTP